MSENLDQLAVAGFALHALTGQQRDVLSELSP